jgi:hypothetical protein
MPGAAVVWPGSFPDLCARLFVQCHHRCRFAARRANQAVAIDQHRLAVTPAIALLAAEVFRQVLAPPLVARGRFQADQVAVRSQDVQQVAVHRRRRTRTLPIGPAAGPGWAEFGFPDHRAVGQSKAHDVLVLVVGDRQPIAHRIQLVTDDRHARVAAPGPAGFPHQRRAVLRPFGQQSRVRRHRVPLRAAELRPFAGQGGKLGEHGGRPEPEAQPHAAYQGSTQHGCTPWQMKTTSKINRTTLYDSTADLSTKHPPSGSAAKARPHSRSPFCSPPLCFQ